MEKDKNILYDLHYNQKLSSLKIAAIYNVNSKTVRTWFYKYDIKLIGNTFQKGTSNSYNRVKSEKVIQLLKTVNIGRSPHNKGIGNKAFTCKVCSKLFEDKPYRRSKYCSEECRDNSRGESHWRYRGLDGRSIQTKRNWKDYKEFKKAVHIRDSNKCRICLSKGEEVHHLQSYSKNEKLRFEPTNGLLLCKTCHKQVHIICGRNNYSLKKFNKYFKFNTATNTWVRSALATW